MLAGLRRVLADPFCRWEVRRYWTRRMRLGALVATAGCWGLAWYLTELTGWHDQGFELRAAAMMLVASALICRVPLCLLAVVAGATAVSAERAAGQLEQVTLTPIDPRRYCLARLLGRLRGLVPPWLLIGAGLTWVVGFAWADALRGRSPGLLALALLLVLPLQLDLALALLTDVAVGMRFGCTAGSVAGAAARAVPVAFLLVPFATVVFGAIGGAVLGGSLSVVLQGGGVWHDGPGPSSLEVLVFVGAAAGRLSLGGLVAWATLRDAEEATAAVLLQPGERLRP